MKKATCGLTMIIALALMSGCAGLNPGASRSQTQNYYDSVFYVGCVPATDETAPPLALSAGDLFAQAMMIEHSGGDESDTASQTQEVTTDTSLEPVTGTDAITALVGAGAQGITAGLKDKPATEADAAGVDPDCPDGNCAPE